MTIPKVKPLTWAAFEVLTSAQMNLMDTHMTQALDGLNGGVYALGTDVARGDGYYTLNAEAATAVPAGDTAVVHIKAPTPMVANLSGLWVEVDNPVGSDQPALWVTTSPTMSSGGIVGLDVEAGGTGRGIVVVGGEGTGVATVKGGDGASILGGNGARGARIDAGASAANTLEAGQGIYAVGGEYGGGDWAGAALTLDDFPHGGQFIGGASDDSKEGVDILTVAGITMSSTGIGVYAIGGEGTGLDAGVTSTKGGAGGLFQGGDGLTAGSGFSTRAGGHGAVGKGGEGDFGSGGHGIVGVGAILKAGVTRASGASAGSGGYFYGGAGDANGGTNINNAGHGLFGEGGENTGPDTEDQAGHGGLFVGGLAAGADVANGGDGNGVQASPSTLGLGTILPVGSGYQVWGAGVYGSSINTFGAKSGLGLGVVGIAKSRADDNIGVFGIAEEDNTGGATGICIGVQGTIALAAGLDDGSAAMYAKVQVSSANAAALRVQIPDTCTKGHIEASNLPTNFPTSAGIGQMFFSAAATASMEGSLFITRASPARWSRIVDDSTPWLVRAWGVIRVDTGTVAIEEDLEVLSTAATNDDLTINFTSALFDGANDWTAQVTENTDLPSAGIVSVGVPAIKFKTAAQLVVGMVSHTTGSFLANLNSLDYAIEFTATGRVNAIF